MSDLDEQIAENAAAPKSITIDGETVTEHSLKEQIEADKYLAGKNAAARPHAGLRFTKIIPPGAG